LARIRRTVGLTQGTLAAHAGLRQQDVSNYERGLVHHVGTFEELEDEFCTWVPGDKSPNRLDAAVWALTDLMLGSRTVADFGYVF